MIYVGLGFYSGHKGWLCWSPSLKRLFCTRHCHFDETFMQMRTHDQRILGFYDTTPRRQMQADHLGNPDDASKVADELNELPLPFEPEELDAVPDPSLRHKPFCHPEGNHFMDASAIPSFPTTTASGGAAQQSTTTVSGGATQQPTTQASGGDTPQPTTKASGGSKADSMRRKAAAGGGANAGSRLPTPSSSAGEQLPAIPSNTVCINRQYLGDDFDWEKLGPRRIREVAHRVADRPRHHTAI
jgi:hypothetical protein